MDEALSDLIVKTSDAYSLGINYRDLVEGLSSEGLEPGALELRDRLLALIYLACESCGFPRKGGGDAGTPDEYKKGYGVFTKNLVALRKTGVGFQQLDDELSRTDLAQLDGEIAKKQVVPELNGIKIPDGLAEIAKLILLTFDIVIKKGPP